MPLKTRYSIDVFNPAYNPNALLDEVKRRLGFKRDIDFAVYVGIDHAVISKLRRRRVPLTPWQILAILDAVPDMSILELRQIVGIKAPLP